MVFAPAVDEMYPVGVLPALQRLRTTVCSKGPYGQVISLGY